MVQVLIGDLIAEVRTTLDENSTESSYLLNDAQNISLDDIIESKIVESVRAVEESCPVWMLSGEAMVASIASNSDGSGRLSLPDDFLRIVAIKMTEWDTAVYSVENMGSQKALMQKNKYVRGNVHKPVLVFAKDASGKRIIEYYSVNSNAVIEIAVYVKIPAPITVEGSKYLNFPAILRQSIVSHCAGLVEVSRGNVELAKSFFQLSESHYN